MRCVDALGREAAGVLGVGGGPTVVVPEGARRDLRVDVREPEQGDVHIEREAMMLRRRLTQAAVVAWRAARRASGGEDTGCARDTLHFAL